MTRNLADDIFVSNEQRRIARSPVLGARAEEEEETFSFDNMQNMLRQVARSTAQLTLRMAAIEENLATANAGPPDPGPPCQRMPQNVQDDDSCAAAYQKNMPERMETLKETLALPEAAKKFGKHYYEIKTLLQLWQQREDEEEWVKTLDERVQFLVHMCYGSFKFAMAKSETSITGRFNIPADQIRTTRTGTSSARGRGWPRGGGGQRGGQKFYKNQAQTKDAAS